MAKLPTSATATNPLRLVYIAGIGRSGSTLLDRLVDQMEGWVSIGEVVHLWRRSLLANERCGCGKRFSDCATWQAVGEVAFGGWDTVDVQAMQRLQASVERDRHVPRLLAPSASPSFRRRLEAWNGVIARILLAVREVTGARVLVDSSKHVSTLLARSHMAEVDLVPVHLVRDSRGVAYSWAKSVARASADEDVDMAKWSPLETSLRYAGYNTVLAGAFRDRVIVRYEDVVADPKREVGRIARRLDDEVGDQLQWDGTAVRFGPSHGLSGNPMRQRTGRMELRHDDAWRDHLPAPQRRLVTAVTLPILMAAGYPVVRRRRE